MYIFHSQLNARFSDPSPLVSAKSGKSPSALDLELPSSSFPEASGPVAVLTAKHTLADSNQQKILCPNLRSIAKRQKTIKKHILSA